MHISVNLSHYSVIVRCLPVGRYNDRTVSAFGDVVGPHDVIPSDAEVRGHGRRLDEVVQRVHTLSARYATIRYSAVQDIIINISVQAVLGSEIKGFLAHVKDAVFGYESFVTLHMPRR